MLLEAVEPRPARGREHLSIDAQLREALARGPFREVRVIAFPGNDERREERELPAGIVAYHLRGDAVLALWHDRHVVVGTVLRSELDVEQAQEVIDLRLR